MPASQPGLPKRVVRIDEAVAYGRTRCGGAFSRHILRKLLKQKKVTAYQHLGTMLIDLDSIDRYVRKLPIAAWPPRDDRRETK